MIVFKLNDNFNDKFYEFVSYNDKKEKFYDVVQSKGFKKVELSLQPPKLINLMNYMRDCGAYGVGMSSFGPAIYTVYDKNNKDIVKATKEYLSEEEGDVVFTTRAQNHGFEFIEK